MVAKGSSSKTNPYVFSTPEYGAIYKLLACSGTYSGSFGEYYFTADSNMIYAFATIKSADENVSVSTSGLTLTIGNKSDAGTKYILIKID